MMYNWENEILTKDIINRLKNGQNEIDSREYLRPIFKWTKLNTKNYDVDKAFEFASYMVKLSKIGDEDKSIPIQKTLQPLFAYNTLVLMSQRISAPYYAMKAFNEMKKNEYDIDVFTLTALLDVIGRSNEKEYGLSKSLAIFYEMLETSKYDSDNNKKLRPNVVTFVTLMRLIGKKLETNENENEIIDDSGNIVINLLNLAHELSLKENHTVGAEINQIDMSIYNAALAVTVRSLDENITFNILQIMKDRSAELNDLSIRILGKLVHKLNKRGILYFLRKLVDCDLITSSQLSLINDSANSRDDGNSKLPLSIQRNKDRDIDCLNTSRDRDVKYDNDIALALKQRNKIQGLGSSYAGCLGPDAPETLRHSIVIHDTTKLLEKTYQENGGNIYRVTESCFVTLIHSCRKRKWSNQVKFILDFVNNLVHHGVPEKNIVPLTHIGPSYLLYEAALDAYFAMDLVENALELYKLIDFNSIFDEDTSKSKEYAFFSFLIKGFFQCGNAVYALEVFFNMKSRNIAPTLKLLHCMMRGLGGESSFNDGIEILKELSQSSSVTIPISSLLCILLESSATLNNNTNSIEFLETCRQAPCLTPEFKQSIELMINMIDPEFISICLMLAVSSSSIDIANMYIMNWQELGILPSFSFLYNICIEAITSSNPNIVTKSLASLPFKSFIRNGPVRLIDTKRSFIKRIIIAIKEGSDSSSSTKLSLREPWMTLICKPLPSSTTPFMNCTVDDDCYINHYFTHCVHTDYDNDSIRVVSGALLFQYLWLKLINIRSKNGKMMIQNNIQIALKTSLQQSDDNNSKINHFINILLRSSTYTYLGGRPISKIISLVFDELEKFRESSCVTNDLDINDIPIIINGTENAMLSLDVIREVTKAFPILKHIDGRRLVLSSLLDILEKDLEKSIKVIQYMYTNKMLLEDDDSDSDSMRLTQERIETVLFRIVISDPNANWNSLVTYINACNHPHDTCKRVIGKILSLDDSFEVKDICQKLLRKMELTDVVEFSHLWKNFSLMDDDIGSNIGYNIDNNNGNVDADYLDLPQDVTIMIINNDNQIDFDVESILISSNLIAIDVEWRPFSSSSLANKCSLLQIACMTNIFLFDLMSLEKKWMDNECNDDIDDDYCPNFRNLMKSLFTSNNIIKLGFGLSGDFNRLSASFPNSSQYNFKELINYFDLSLQHQFTNKSLAVLCKENLGKSLDKRLQKSDWQRRPLLKEQITYAAIDAYVLIILYEKLYDKK